MNSQQLFDKYNNPDLDPDIIYLYLWKEKRTPQNEKEHIWLKEIEDTKKKGQSFELPFN